MDTFVNPIPGIRLDKWISFDFPVGIWTKGCHANVDLFHSSEAPTQESVYGKLGAPPRNQGFPCMYEFWPEAEDPWRHDQIIDIDRKAVFDHTARLSGSFVRLLAHYPNYLSRVKMMAISLTGGHGVPFELFNTGPTSLVPGPKVPNQWYWLDPSTEQELIFTAHAVLNTADWKQRNAEPGIYNLVVKWEFWEKDGRRLPISGFDESMTFELSAATINL